MTIIEVSITIQKPVDTVFAFITDLENQRKLSLYITGIEAAAPLQLGATYKLETTSMGFKNTTTNQVVAFEPNQRFGVKTLAAPPASDVTNTYLLAPAGNGTQLTLQMDATLMPAGMPNMPGMEDMLKKQMSAGLETTLATLKQLIEG